MDVNEQYNFDLNDDIDQPEKGMIEPSEKTCEPPDEASGELSNRSMEPHEGTGDLAAPENRQPSQQQEDRLTIGDMDKNWNDLVEQATEMDDAWMLEHQEANGLEEHADWLDALDSERQEELQVQEGTSQDEQPWTQQNPSWMGQSMWANQQSWMERGTWFQQQTWLEHQAWAAQQARMKQQNNEPELIDQDWIVEEPENEQQYAWDQSVLIQEPYVDIKTEDNEVMDVVESPVEENCLIDNEVLVDNGLENIVEELNSDEVQHQVQAIELANGVEEFGGFPEEELDEDDRQWNLHYLENDEEIEDDTQLNDDYIGPLTLRDHLRMMQCPQYGCGLLIFSKHIDTHFSNLHSDIPVVPIVLNMKYEGVIDSADYTGVMCTLAILNLKSPCGDKDICVILKAAVVGRRLVLWMNSNFPTSYCYQLKVYADRWVVGWYGKLRNKERPIIMEGVRLDPREYQEVTLNESRPIPIQFRITEKLDDNDDDDDDEETKTNNEQLEGERKCYDNDDLETKIIEVIDCHNNAPKHMEEFRLITIGKIKTYLRKLSKKKL